MQTTPINHKPGMAVNQRWHIFCDIVDNYGDIGVCWRLARQLAAEYALEICLWINDGAVAKQLIGELDLTQLHAPLQQPAQVIQGVALRAWTAARQQAQPTQSESANGEPTYVAVEDVADVVIEAFGCELPSAYVSAMRHKPPLWINLEYLSAETWVEGCHAQISLDAATGLKKYFFFPGFRPATGGLIREKQLIEERDAFQQSPLAQRAFLDSLHLPAAMHAQRKLSLFCYPQAPVAALLDSLATASQPSVCLIAGNAITQAAAYFGHATGQSWAGLTWSKGNLTVLALPFLTQAQYDRLLWVCELNFVRGEDSWVRAIWAGKPMVWQPYRQQEDAHASKLEAFLHGYAQGLPDDTASELRQLYLTWSGLPAWSGLAQSADANLASLLAIMSKWEELAQHGRRYSEQLAMQQDLAAKLVFLCRNRV